MGFVAQIKELPIHMQERMYNLYDKVGFIPNLFHALSHRPDEFRRYIEYYDIVTARSTSPFFVNLEH